MEDVVDTEETAAVAAAEMAGVATMAIAATDAITVKIDPPRCLTPNLKEILQT